MKLRVEPVTMALVVFAAFYFGEWVVNKVDPPTKQCWYETKVDEDHKVYEWRDCEKEA